MLSVYVALSIAFARIDLSYAQGQVDSTLLTFRSRPDLSPPRLNVNISKDGVTPGYIFMAPYQNSQNTALLYDTDGSLVWSGYGVTGAGSNTHDFHVCTYNGTKHLCFFEGEQFMGYARGQAVIFDTALRSVRTVTSRSGLSNIDQHEFNIVGDSAMNVIYQPERYDLSAFNVTNGQGWVQDAIFQDTNLTTDELIFQWSALNHVALSEGYVGPNQTNIAGTGFSARSPWDYFHINSVDKNVDGDYLISGRHVSTLYKISGKDGHIVWRCGGKLSDVELLNGLNWSYQHDARWLSQNATTEVISLFDNASNGYDRSANHSAGYIIKIDHTANPPTASLLQSYLAPADIPISDSQGNLQVLNPDDWINSNVFIGWGSQPYVTEHDSSGNIIYRADVTGDSRMNYRAFKYNISLTPTDSPALYTYALNTDADTSFYMSWNGATEVRSWRIYGRSTCHAQWILIDETPKTGFETKYTVSGYYEYGMVEAVAQDDTSIRNSTNSGVQTFVPGSSLSNYCTADGCDVAKEYGISTVQEDTRTTQSGCAVSPVPTESNSSLVSDETNSAISLQPGIWSMTLMMFCSSIMVGALL